MATYRCNACQGIYVSPQPPGVEFWHTCPLVVKQGGDPLTGPFEERPGHRDENVDRAITHAPVEPGQPRPRNAPPMKPGTGRVKLSDADLLTGADAARLGELRAMPGVAAPDL